eukprot:669060-Ditylum_brightwellii.AAC.1
MAFPLVLDLLLRKSREQEPVPNQEILQKKKMLAEGMPSEIKMFLGWAIGSHLHKVTSPAKKGSEWKGKINAILDGRKDNN